MGGSTVDNLQFVLRKEVEGVTFKLPMLALSCPSVFHKQHLQIGVKHTASCVAVTVR